MDPGGQQPQTQEDQRSEPHHHHVLRDGDFHAEQAELRQVEQPWLRAEPASLPAESREEPAAESPKAQAAWSAA